MSLFDPRRYGIRARLVLMVTLLVGAIAGLATLYFPARLRSAHLEALAEETGTVAQMVAEAVAAVVVFDDRETAAAVLASAGRVAGLAEATIVDTEGRLFASYAAPEATVAGELHRAAAPISHLGRRLGTVHVAAPLAPLEEHVRATQRRMAALCLVLFAASLVASFAIALAVTRPLRQMVGVARRIAAGERDCRATATDRLDEAGELALAFNHMLDRLAAARAELEQLNSELEARVAARTRELEEEVRERRLAAERLRDANERFALAAAAVEEAIYDYRIAEGRVEWSDGISRVFGYPAEEVGPTYEWWAERLHPDDAGAVLQQVEADVAAGRPFVAEYRFRASDGDYRHVLDRGMVVCDDAGKVVRMVGTLEDVTKIRLLEEQYQHAQRMDAIGRLAGGVAHDFNNLLTAILGYSDLLQASLDDDPAPRSCLAEIRKAGERAAALTQQLLAFSRKQVVAPKVIDVNEVLLDLGRMLARLIGENIRLHTGLASRPMRVLCDPRQLEQVIVNLAVNARDAMPGGGTLTLLTEERVVRLGDDRFAMRNLPAGRYVALSVRDTGHGMDEATKRRIFEPFFTTKPTGQGTGLGLATVYGIVQQCGGQVLVDSAPGRGASFTVLLPLVVDGRREPDTEPLPEPESAPGGTESILVVEDEPSVRRLASGALEAHGYRVTTAAGAEEALALADEVLAGIDLVITDVVMPGMNGRQLVEELRRRYPGLPALLVSGYTDDVIVRQGVSVAETPFLEKPFLPSQLLARVRELLDERSAAAVA